MYSQINVNPTAGNSRTFRSNFEGGQVVSRIQPPAGCVHKAKVSQTLFAEGDDAESVFEVVQGVLKLYKLLPDGRRQIVGFVSKARLIGFSGEETYQYTAEAVTEVSLCRYSRSQFDRLLDEHPGFARRVLSARSQELQSAQSQMVLLGRKTAVERIATFLLCLRELQSASACRSLHVPMTRADIADYLGLTIETVSRTLTRLKKEQLIILVSATEITITNGDRLEEMASGEAQEAA